MNVAYFHNLKAGAGSMHAKDVIRRLQDDGHQALYVSIKDNNWERVWGEPIDRALVAGGDGTVSRLVGKQFFVVLRYRLTWMEKSS